MDDAGITQLLAANKNFYIRGEKRQSDFITRPLREEEVAHHNQHERHIVLSDYHHRVYAHYDYVSGKSEVRKAHDPLAMRVVEEFMAWWRPTHIHYLGDMVDFHAISKFCKSAPPEDELDESIQAVRGLFWKHRTAHPHAVMAYYQGNHEQRWEAYLEQHASPIRKLGVLSYEAIFGARELRMSIHPYKKRVQILPGVLELTHGDKVRNKSGLSAHAMLEKGVSGISGHTHRLGMIYKTNRAGATLWAENGCLCRLDPDYMEDPDWQQGFSVIYVDKHNARFHCDQLPITGQGQTRRIVYAGKVIEVTE